MFDRTDDHTRAAQARARTATPSEPARGPARGDVSAQPGSAQPGSDQPGFAAVVAHARDATAAARALGESASGIWRSAQDVLQRQVEERPAATLGLAAGLGFLVAGGLATPAARAAMRLGGRAALALVVRELLMESRDGSDGDGADADARVDADDGR